MKTCVASGCEKFYRDYYGNIVCKSHNCEPYPSKCTRCEGYFCTYSGCCPRSEVDKKICEICFKQPKYSYWKVCKECLNKNVYKSN